MRATHLQAEERYTELRKEALATAEGLIPATPGLRLRLVSASALSHAKAWADVATREVDWDWFAGYTAFRFRHPKRFELAIWEHDKLVSLSLGRPTYHGHGLRLDFIEAGGDQSRVRVFPVTMVAMTVYAAALGAGEIRLVHPINDAVKAYYERFGLKYVAKGDYLYKKLLGVA